MRSLRGFVVVVAFAGLAGFGCGSDSSDATDLGSLKFDVTVSGHDTEVTSFDVPHADTAGSETVADTVQPGGDAVESGPDAIGPEVEEIAEPTDVSTETGDVAAEASDVGAEASDVAGDAPDGVAPNVFWLTVLHSSDTESAMLPSDTYGGVAYFATLMKYLKTEAAAFEPPKEAGDVPAVGTLVVSAGDYFLPGLNF